MTTELLQQRKRRPIYQFGSGTRQAFASRNGSGLGGASGSGGELFATIASTDATVASGVPQADGTVTVTVSGGTGPYTVHSLDGYPDQTGAGPDFVFLGLPGSTTYTFWVEDSVGGIYPADYPISTLSVYVYTQAYNWHAAYSSTLALVSTFPNTRALTITKFDPTDPIYSNGTLSGVVFRLENTFRSSLTVTNNLGVSQTVQVTVSDVSHFYVEGSNRVNDTITLATFGPTVLGIGATQPYVRRIGTSDTSSAEDTSPATLAAVTGSGNLSASFISDAVVNTIVQGASLTLSNGADAACTATVTYNYTVPRQ